MKKINGILSIAAASAIVMSLAAAPVHADMTINVGDYVQMGKYYDQDILWRCVGYEKVSGYDDNGNPIMDATDTSTEYKDGYLPLMLSDKIITAKSYDVGGVVTTGSHSRGKDSGKYRQVNGSNYWGDSNIRSWLNSEAEAGNVVWACGNASNMCGQLSKGASDKYANEAGFLTNFNEIGKTIMTNATQKSILDPYEYSQTPDANSLVFNGNIADCTKNYADATSEQTTDRMFLLDVQQISNLYNNTAILGTEYYIGKTTKACVNNTENKDSNMHIDAKWKTYLRTPYCMTNSDNVYVLHSNGNLTASEAYKTDTGIRPAFFLDIDEAGIGSGKGKEFDPYILTADSIIKVRLNSENINFDQVPIIQEGRTLVPVRAIFEAMGATVLWDDKTQTVTAKKGITNIKLTIDDNHMNKNGEVSEIDVPAQIVNGRTLVPVRVIAEAFDCEVTWDGDSKTVQITQNTQKK